VIIKEYVGQLNFESRHGIACRRNAICVGVAEFVANVSYRGAVVCPVQSNLALAEPEEIRADKGASNSYTPGKVAANSGRRAWANCDATLNRESKQRSNARADEVIVRRGGRGPRPERKRIALVTRSRECDCRECSGTERAAAKG